MIIPGTEHVNASLPNPGLLYCHLHQQYLNKDQQFWVIAEGDYHVACPECYAQETGGGKRCEAVQSKLNGPALEGTVHTPPPVCKVRNCTGNKKAWVDCASCLTPLCIQCAHLDPKSSKYYCPDHRPKVVLVPSPSCERCKQHPTATWCTKCSRSICAGCLESSVGISILCSDCAS